MIYSDLDWAGCLKTRLSQMGMIIFCNNGLVFWDSKKQSVIAGSSTEVEYYALAKCSQEARWLQKLLKSVLPEFNETITIFNDNESAQRIGESERDTKQSRHIDVCFHIVREQIACGAISLKHVAGKENIADLLTKGVGANILTDLIWKYVGYRSRRQVIGADGSTGLAETGAGAA